MSVTRLPGRLPLVKRIILRAFRSLPSGRLTDPVVNGVRFVLQHDRMPRMRAPVLFNDRLFKLKIDGTLHDPLRQFITDKEYVKQYVAGLVGKQYTLETYDILRTPQDVDELRLSRLPCVVKPTHMSGPVLICTDGNGPIDRDLMKRWLRTNYYRRSREINYKFLEPKIIVEAFFSEDGGMPPRDYKIFCFHGRPKLIEVDADRFTQHTRNFYDTVWERLEVSVKYPAAAHHHERPKSLDLMLDIARELSKPFSSIRVDMYASDSRVKVGELTNCHEAAAKPSTPARQSSGWATCSSATWRKVAGGWSTACMARSRPTPDRGRGGGGSDHVQRSSHSGATDCDVTDRAGKVYPSVDAELVGTGCQARPLRSVAAHHQMNVVEVRAGERALQAIEPLLGVKSSPERNEGRAMCWWRRWQTSVLVVGFDCRYCPSEIIEDGKNGVLVYDGMTSAACRGRSGCCCLTRRCGDDWQRAERRGPLRSTSSGSPDSGGRRSSDSPQGRELMMGE